MDTSASLLDRSGIIGGEKVWMINCEVKVLDCSGGNVIDACRDVQSVRDRRPGESNHLILFFLCEVVYLFKRTRQCEKESVC